jgi:hypothetical protein
MKQLLVCKVRLGPGVKIAVHRIFASVEFHTLHKTRTFSHWQQDTNTIGSGRRLKKEMKDNTMKRFKLLAMVLSVVCGLFAWSATQAYADSVTMQFTGVGGVNSGGVYTYPYDFTVTPTGGGTSQNLSLMCISFNEEIYLQNPNETWTANIVTAGSLGTLDEEDAYLYTQAEADLTSNPTESGAANWAAWALNDEDTLNLQEQFLTSNGITGQEYIYAVDFLSGLSSVDLADYASYLVYVPVDGTQNNGDGPPQTFIGDPPPISLTPEPGSLLLLGTGLLVLALFLYRRRHSTATSS